MQARPGPVSITVCPDYSMSAADRLNLAELAAVVYPPDCAQERAGGSIQWAPKTIHTLVRDERGLLTCHVGGLFRPVLVDRRPVKIGGIGGVMTAPLARRQGHARKAMATLSRHLVAQQASFLLLFCASSLRGFYERLGWRPFSGTAVVEQRGRKVEFTFGVAMVQDGLEGVPIATT